MALATLMKPAMLAPLHVVDGVVAFGFAVFDALAVDAFHDLMEALVDFFFTPGKTKRVLRLLKTGDGDASCIGRFGGAEEDLSFLESVDAGEFGGHVRAFADCDHSIFDRVSASSLLISFWVAQGRAISTATDQGRPSEKVAEGYLSTYSLMRPRFTSLSSLM